MPTTTVELVTFNTKPGVNSDDISKTNEAMEEFLRQQTGFIYRSLSQDETGTWYDIIYWQSDADAQAAGKNFMQHPAGQALMELIDNNSTMMRHMQPTSEVYQQNM